MQQRKDEADKHILESIYKDYQGIEVRIRIFIDYFQNSPDLSTRLLWQEVVLIIQLYLVVY